MKIGVMGGTFDPIHIGHLLLGEFAYSDFKLDEIWFLPNGDPPHKEVELTEEGLQHRIAMVERAVAEVPYFRISFSEAKINTHSYTYKTMGEFRRLYPQDEFYFILGADALFSIEKWKFFQEIFPNCTILAAKRDDKEISELNQQITYLTEKYNARIKLLRAPFIEVSSTTIRERVAKGLPVRYMVPDTVAKYIEQYQLYRKDGQHV